MPVNIWVFESELYALLDSHGMRNETKLLKRKYPLGDGQFVALNIVSNKPLSNSQVFSTMDVKFRINFWKNKNAWFRIDNCNTKRFLHFHLDEGGTKEDCHKELKFAGTLGELISHVCEKAKEFLKGKFPQADVKDSEGFGGFA